MEEIKFIIFAIVLCLNNCSVRAYFAEPEHIVCHQNEQFCVVSEIKSTDQFNDVIIASEIYRYQYYGYLDSELSSFTEMQCKNSTFKKIPLILFQKFSGLCKFAAKSVQLEEIARDDFKFAEFLDSLDLSNNDIIELRNLVFFYAKRLETINLSFNKIKFIHEGAFDDMSENLISLDLSFNQIASFKEDFFITLGNKENTNLEIKLNGNLIEFIEASMNNSALKEIFISTLNLDDNRLKFFNSSKLTFGNLQLGNNRLESFEISAEKLELSNNKLKELKIANTAIYINAKNNSITSLKIDNHRIETLLLSGNRLQKDALLSVILN